MIPALILWAYLLAHAGLGSALGAPEGCTTDNECGCTLDCLGAAIEDDSSEPEEIER